MKNLNTPALKVGGRSPIFWLKEITSEWECRACNKRQTQAVSFELDAIVNKKTIKLYVCTSCALTLMQETLAALEELK